MHGALTNITQEVKSTRNGRMVRVRYLGTHLLQFEKTSPVDSDWIRWDHEVITEDQLVRLLALDLDPDDPARSMKEKLRDRHAMQPDDMFERRPRVSA